MSNITTTVIASIIGINTRIMKNHTNDTANNTINNTNRTHKATDNTNNINSAKNNNYE